MHHRAQQEMRHAENSVSLSRYMFAQTLAPVLPRDKMSRELYVAKHDLGNICCINTVEPKVLLQVRRSIFVTVKSIELIEITVVSCPWTVSGFL